MPPPAIRLTLNTRARVLIIDRHEVSRGVLSALLRTEGLHVVADTADGPQGVAAARALAPDVVLLDFLPGDLEMCEAVHALLGMPSRPSLVLTSSTDRARFHRLPERLPFLAKADICARTLLNAVVRAGEPRLVISQM
jgi:DNA-binding NarL/FixJ family response regulator